MFNNCVIYKPVTAPEPAPSEYVIFCLIVLTETFATLKHHTNDIKNEAIKTPSIIRSWSSIVFMATKAICKNDVRNIFI